MSDSDGSAAMDGTGTAIPLVEVVWQKLPCICLQQNCRTGLVNDCFI